MRLLFAVPGDARFLHDSKDKHLMDVDTSMRLLGIIIACIGGCTVAAVRLDGHRSSRSRWAEILGYVLILSGGGFFIAELIRPG
jgi:hypothetical protein